MWEKIVLELAFRQHRLCLAAMKSKYELLSQF
jgi:hypothetical protein